MDQKPSQLNFYPPIGVRQRREPDEADLPVIEYIADMLLELSVMAQVAGYTSLAQDIQGVSVQANAYALSEEYLKKPYDKP